MGLRHIGLEDHRRLTLPTCRDNTNPCLYISKGVIFKYGFGKVLQSSGLGAPRPFLHDCGDMFLIQAMDIVDAIPEGNKSGNNRTGAGSEDQIEAFAQRAPEHGFDFFVPEVGHFLQHSVDLTGGFSGRESSISVSWLANEVRSGHLRWLIVDQGGGGLPGDTRAGSRVAASRR